MKAIVQNGYGSPEVFELTEIDKPVVKDGEMLVRVHAAALHGLRDAGKVQPWQKVLINGASGGVGTFAVQIAKAFGAEVTGVCSTRNVDMVRAIGADHVIDYTQEDFTQSGQRYDLILDQVANHSLSDCRRALAPKGTHIPNSGHSGIGYAKNILA
jgi:NADPH:quinone reductase-like Zn-dependent oxidoreductase